MLKSSTLRQNFSLENLYHISILQICCGWYRSIKCCFIKIALLKNICIVITFGTSKSFLSGVFNKQIKIADADVGTQKPYKIQNNLKKLNFFVNYMYKIFHICVHFYYNLR
eukprot:TRINITY_DN4982_c0_g1_i4.p4 TRINITY_DN4982_c0_g1~~TRINITY_DN4982_c0_g1_i4.p4  ORF type:complete len:111 (-),score=2.55 TRINITY_DN4982_c0_g1_i4:1011-1343(-)